MIQVQRRLRKFFIYKSDNLSMAVVQSGCLYNVPNVGDFNTLLQADALNFLESGLSISTYLVGGSPLTRLFETSNVGVSSDGAITLTVPGNQSTSPVSSAQLVTGFSDILYGSVSTVAEISSIPGTTNAVAFYANDNQEVDLAFVTYDNSQFHCTNQQASYGAPETSYGVEAPGDVSSTYHEYRIDWIADKTEFFVDGVSVKAITENVPSIPGFWLWNNWSSGNGWTFGPPEADNVFKIKSINAYFNRTSVTDAIAADPSRCLPGSSSTVSIPNIKTATSLDSISLPPSSVTSSILSSSEPNSASMTAATSGSTASSTSFLSTSSSSETSSASSSSSTDIPSSSSSTGLSLVGTSTVEGYGNCGTGSPVTGTYACGTGFTCTSQNVYYYQCVSSSIVVPTAPATTSATITESSSSVKSSSSSSISTTSTSAPVTSTSASISTASLTPKTVSFTTVTTGHTGSVTTTTTIVGGLTGTILVQTPSKVTAKASSASGYSTTTIDSGTATTVGYITATPNRGSSGIVIVVYPTPATTCGNAGISYAAYSNKVPGGQATKSYPAYIPEAYKTVTPQFSGTTDYIAEANAATGTITVYGQRSVAAQQLVLDHTFYLFARQDGYYSFNIPYTDDIQFVWFGNKAVSGWTRANADLMQFWSTSTQTPQTIAHYLTLGQYLPIRVQWANGGGIGRLEFNIYAPDGSTLLESNGENTGSSSPDVVRFPCNSAQGARFPAFGSET